MSNTLRITVSALLLCVCVCAHSQSKRVNIHVSRPLIELEGDSVCLSFYAVADDLPSDYRVEFRPVLTGETNELALASVCIAGKKNMRSAERKLLFSSRKMLPGNLPVAVPAGDTLYYKETFAYAPWMKKYSLSIDRVLTGCCNTELLPSCPVEGMLAYAEEPEPVAPEVAEPEPVIVLSPTEELAGKETFIRPADSYDADRKAGNYYRDPDALRVYFRQNRIVIDPTYLGNDQTLERLDKALKVMAADSAVRITKLLVVGYASIEGTLERNTYLAGHRAKALRDFATARGVALHNIEIVNMGEGWDELRDMVANSTDVPYREEILRIIDNVPVLKGREKQLMDLRHGVPYRWMMEHFFPKQRNAGYVKVYYEKTEK